MVLVVNPAINVTVFDALKERLLTILSRRRGKAVRSLSNAQAFVLGSLSKALATILTYPLIRVKVLQQTERSPRDARLRRAQSKGTLELLSDITHAQGLGGLYRGCEAQLLSTVLKSGLLLMSKEQVLRLTLALLRRLQPSAVAAHPE